MPNLTSKIQKLLSIFCLSTNTIFADEFNYTYSQQIPEQTIPAQPQQYGYNYGAPTNNYNSSSAYLALNGYTFLKF